MAIELPIPYGVGGNPEIAFDPTLMSPRAHHQIQSGISQSGPDQGTTYSQISPPMNSLPSALVLFGDQQHQQQALGVQDLASEAPGGYWGFENPNALFPWPEPSSVADPPVAVGDPFTTLEQGQLFEPQPLWTSTDLQGQPRDKADEPIPLGLVILRGMPPSQVLFSFGVLGIMANLGPNFAFQYGGFEGKKIGVRLTMYGHTVVIQPLAGTVNSARVAACLRALEKLRKFNPLWLLPPMPTDGPTTPEWNWVKLLQDYCGDQGWPLPGYKTSTDGNAWHCDIVVNGLFFRTTRQCESQSESENTAAHEALYQLLVTEMTDPSTILPPDAPLLTMGVGSKITVPKKQDSGPSLQKPAPVTTGNKAAKQSGKSSGGTPVPAPKPVQSGPAQSTRASRRKKAKPPPPPPPPPPPSEKRKRRQESEEFPNANLVPLENSRFVPQVEPEVVEDPLAMLKAVKTSLDELHYTASYYRIMKTICNVLKITYPEIRLHKNTEIGAPSSHLIQALFDDSNPYLSRASPVLLMNIPSMNEESAHSLGVKKVVLFLLNMLKEDAGITSSDETYVRKLKTLRELEVEIEGRLRRC